MKLWFVGLILIFSISVSATAKDLTIVYQGKEKVFTLKELKSKLKTVTVTIDDPVYKRQKTYDGFIFKEVLTLAGIEESATGDEIVFTAVDGYAPNTSFESIKNRKGILVFREKGKKDFEYEKVAQGKSLISMAPYYLVWEEIKTADLMVPWPYQLVKIEVVNFKQKYEKLYPKGATLDSDVMKGFILFKNQCIRCHSINLQGGDLGPELNAPKNVTEYWAKNTLKDFIHNASSFRYKSKMPTFAHLKGEEIDHIFKYLEHMKEHKISKEY